MRLTLACCALSLFVACSSRVGGNDDGGTVETLVVEPGDDTITVIDEQPETLVYRVYRRVGGELEDVSDSATIAIADATLGTFSGVTLTSTASYGGQTTVTATLGDESGSTSLTVMAESDSLGPGVPPSTPDDFAGANEEQGGPALVYPQNNVALPPNLGVLDVHYDMGGGSDTIIEVTLESEFTTRRLYYQVAGNTSYTEVTETDWSSFAAAKGGTLSLRSRGAGAVHAGGTAAIDVIGTAIDGGIYYWAAGSTDGSPEGIYRHDMGATGQTAEAFFTRTQEPGLQGAVPPNPGRCVACHGISRDGRYIAAVIIDDVTPASPPSTNPGSTSVMIDVETRAPLYEAVSGFDKWNMSAFTGTGNKFIGGQGGVLTLRNTLDGASVTTVFQQAGVLALQATVSPTNDRIAFIRTTDAGSSDTRLDDGELVVMTYDGNQTFGSPQVLATPAVGETFHYPEFSPDGEWLIVNKSAPSDANANDVDSYDEPSADVYIIRADGSGTLLPLDSPNLQDGLTNSWARWAPFVQQTADGEDFYWLTFSSKRAFGVRSTAGPQLWMAPVFPGRLGGSDDPSAPAFWLPFQNINSNNHIAQWTEEVIPTVD